MGVDGPHEQAERAAPFRLDPEPSAVARARKLALPEGRSADHFRSSGPARVRVAVIAASRLYRDGLASMLERYPQVGLVGRDPGGPGTRDRIRHLRADVVLVDMATPGMLGTVETLASAGPGAAVVALAATPEAALRAARAPGTIDACLSQHATIEDLVDVLTQVVRSAAPAARPAPYAREAAGWPVTVPAGARPRLTPRELEVLQLVNEGLSNQEIADRLGIAVATAKNHVHHALEKLRVRRRGEAAAWLRAGAP